MPFHVAPVIRRIEQAREDAGINKKQTSTAFDLLYKLEKLGKKALTVFPANRAAVFIRNFPFTWEPNVAKESEGISSALTFTDAIRQPPFLSITITGEQMVMTGDLKNRWLRIVGEQLGMADAVAHT
jgi:hypothetical protein